METARSGCELMKAYLVFYTDRLTKREFYWTGDFCTSGPAVSGDSCRAAAFPTARAAYDTVTSVSQKNRRCRRMLSWRVALREIRAPITAAPVVEHKRHIDRVLEGLG